MKAVIKIGGSLQGSPSLEAICETIGKVSGRHDLTIVPGGGVFADQVREFQKSHNLSDYTAHLMAIEAMESYGVGLSELIPNFSLSDNLEIAKRGKVIFLPSKSVEQNCELESSWKVTSDSLAAWTCGKIGFDKLILVKRVDGIGKNNKRFLTDLSRQELKNMNQSVVDSKLPEVLERYGITCWVLNGENPERIEELLKTGRTTGTKISGGE